MYLLHPKFILRPTISSGLLEVFLDLGINNGTFILHRRVYEELRKGRDELSQRVAWS